MKFILIIIAVIFSMNCFAAKTIKLIYDNDVGSDDVIALIYLMHQPNISIEGITIAATGVADRLWGARNIADLCYLLKKPTIQIAYGNEKFNDPFVHPFPKFVRESANRILLGKNVPRHPYPKISNSAVELMKKIIIKNKKILILATGPLTNIAEFIEKYPNLKNKIERIVIMGGAVRVKGNIQVFDPKSANFVAEWNIYADPKAAKIVFLSGIPITLVPLDATNQVPITKEFYKSLSQESQLDLKLIYLILKDIVDELGLNTFFNNFYLWDPLAAVIISDPTQAVTESMFMSIDINTAQTKAINIKKFPIPKIDVVTKIQDPTLVLSKFIKKIKRNDNG